VFGTRHFIQKITECTSGTRHYLLFGWDS